VTDVLKCTYSDLKTVKTRGVCQIILEMPIEGMADAFGLLGAPVPGNEVWVAVARLMTDAELVRGIEALAPPPRKPASLAQIAGILCNERAFQQFIKVKNADEAAEYVRAHCRVSSRANIDGNPDATEAFKTLKGEYELWLRCEAA
jgi:hypothetical protein